MSYQVKNVRGLYHILEKDTDLIVAKFSSQKDARSLCRALNLGGGFNGFTPMFFAESLVPIKKVPNE